MKRVAYEEAANVVSSSMVYGLRRWRLPRFVGLDRPTQVEQKVDAFAELGDRWTGFHFHVLVVPESSSWLNFSFACVNRQKHFEHALRHVTWCCPPRNGGWHGHIQHGASFFHKSWLLEVSCG